MGESIEWSARQSTQSTERPGHQPCALLPYLFTLSVAAKVEGMKGPWSIRDLADRGLVRTDGTHANVQFDEDGKELRISWSIEAQNCSGARGG
jgi:hypothetical protein